MSLCNNEALALRALADLVEREQEELPFELAEALARELELRLEQLRTRRAVRLVRRSA